MSFLPDLASWALGGGADGDGNNSSGADASNDTNATTATATATATANNNANTNTSKPGEEDLRARRLARLSGGNTAVVSSSTTPISKGGTGMDVDVEVEEGGNNNSKTTVDNDNVATAMDVDVKESESGMDSNKEEDEMKKGVGDGSLGSFPGPRKKRAKEPVESLSSSMVSSSSPSLPPLSTLSSRPTAVSAPMDPKRREARKNQRKREVILKKVLRVILKGGLLATSSSSSSSTANSNSDGIFLVDVDLDDDGTVGESNVAEILAARLSMPSDGALLPYLAACHRRVGDELRDTISALSRSSSNNSNNSTISSSSPSPLSSSTSTTTNNITDFLREISRQVVSYATSSLVDPDLFESARFGTVQLARCLTNGALDHNQSIIVGTNGRHTSFLHCLLQELLNFDENSDETFCNIVGDVGKHLSEALSRCESVLDEPSPPSAVTTAPSNPSDTSSTSSSVVPSTSSSPSTPPPVVTAPASAIVTALASLCSHKGAARALASSDGFLLPTTTDPKANERVAPAAPPIPAGSTPQQRRFYRMMATLARAGAGSGHLRRSGPALERDTLLGRIISVGLPPESPSVSVPFQNVASRTASDVRKATEGMRRHLTLYREALHGLIRAMVTAGDDAREPVLRFLEDAILVNTGAGAYRPDRSKVSHPQTLQNLAVVLLRLCRPFFDDPKRIDPGYVSSPNHHKGIFATSGSDMVPRLSEDPTVPSKPYEPRNAFVPRVYFLGARALHLGVSAAASHHSHIVRQVGHMAWNIRQRGGDASSDPELDRVLSLQHGGEVSLLSPELIGDALGFAGLTAGFLLSLDGDSLGRMPEHVVDDICDVLAFVARHAPSAFNSGGKEGSSDIFRVAVRLLSPAYSQVSLYFDAGT